MVHGAHAGAEEEPGRSVEGEFGIVEDDFGGELGVRHAGFEACFVGVAGVAGTFCGAEGGWDGDVKEEVAGLRVDSVRDCFGGVDGRAATNGDDGVDAAVFLDEFCGLV